MTPAKHLSKVGLFFLTCAGLLGGISALAQTNQSARFQLIALDPGHFHASLMQKTMYADVDPVVHVYSPGGDDLQDYLKRIESFNARPDKPDHWKEEVHTGSDFLDKMLAEKAGNIVLLAGNNAHKADYILRSVQAGLNVLADPSAAITPADIQKLQQAFIVAASNHVLLDDIMTERFEITTILQRELSQQTEIFGQLVEGTPDAPGISMQTTHYFSKTVDGLPVKRPAWTFDVRQQGEGIIDNAPLVDLVQWAAFPEQSLKPEDVTVMSAHRWDTAITRDQFKEVTGLDDFPDSLASYVKNGVLQVSANGDIGYRLRNIRAQVSVAWNVGPAPGGTDTHMSILRGTLCTLAIRQDEEQNYKPTLYIEKLGNSQDTLYVMSLQTAIQDLKAKYPGIGLRSEGKNWRVTIPDKYDIGHEAHFAQVMENYLAALREGKLPPWEVPNLLTKYATLMQAYKMSR
jgi:predicted dehydrogenase